jgi:dTDP-4-amino-4,6-dideoxygalactose transaminase
MADQSGVMLPNISAYATNNAHMFYFVLPSLNFRTRVIDFLKAECILAVFQYISLHESTFS